MRPRRFTQHMAFRSQKNNVQTNREGGIPSPFLFPDSEKRKKGILEIPEVLFLAMATHFPYDESTLSQKVSDADVFSKFVQLHPPVVRHVQAQL